MTSNARNGELIAEFERRYSKEFDFYDQAARLTHQLLEQHLQQAGIRAIVTARAKSLRRTIEKGEQRLEEKKYKSVDDIYKDIVDLAGVRVALYFPGERDQVGKIIEQNFRIEEPPKKFPSNVEPSYEKRFSGYWATHYRVRLPDALLNESQKRYGEALIEIQVASILMHAWAEVEHDLVYKPLQGELSEDEYAILDELNGLVLSGEIALERLQRAGERRVATSGRKFANNYDLASYLLDRASPLLGGNSPDAVIGRVDILFGLLQALDLAKPDDLYRYIAALSGDFERRPLSEQIIDQLLAEDADRYKLYESIKSRADRQDQGIDVKTQSEIGSFIIAWVELERLLSGKLQTHTPAPPLASVRMNIIREVFSKEMAIEYERLRRFRNYLVHGIEVPSPADIADATDRVRALFKKINKGKKE